MPEQKESMNHLFEIFQVSASRYGQKQFVQMKDNGKYYGYSFIEVYERSKTVGSWLIAQGINPGDRVAILGEGSPEWSVAFSAIQSISGTAVPMDVKLKENEWRFILENSGAKGIFYSSKFKKTTLQFPDGIIKISLEDIEKLSGDATKLPILHSNNPAVIVYTSGTTGNPKGVMISHKNLISDIEMVYKTVEGLFENKNLLSILPLNHLLELTGGFLAPLWGGSTVTYAESLKSSIILERMQETKPDIMLVVPAFLALLWREIERKLSALPPLLQTFLHIAAIASKILEPIGVPASRIVFGKLHKQFGGNMKYFFCGGAPLDLELAKHYESVGLIVLEGYGLTETSPIITVNSPKHRKLGSVGRPLKGVTVRIEDKDENGNGEILVQGANVMLGYYRNEDATNAVIKDNWFYTGDIGHLDEEGFLFITGRKKNLIVTSSGKKIFPEEVEEYLQRSPYIKEVCVVSKPVEKDEEVYALIIPDLEHITSDKITGTVNEVIKNEIRKQTEELANYKRVKDFVIWEGEFPKTTTLKLRRSEIHKIFLEQYSTVQ